MKVNKNLLYGLLVVGLLICPSVGAMQTVDAADDKIIKIFAADSIKKPMHEFESDFENDLYNNKGYTINLTCEGSNKLLTRILNGEKPDIFISADYKLIDDKLIPSKKYTGWDAEFITNSIVIAYRKDSTGSDKINQDNWFDIVNQDGAVLGLGNPNMDPGGYRAVMMIQLANKYYKNNNIFDNLIANNSDISSKENGSGYTIYSPTDGNPNPEKLRIADDSDESMKELQRKDIGYAIVYKNLAAQYQANDSNIQYISLPGVLALDDVNYDYSNINLIQYYGDDSAEKTMTLSSILYGATTLNWANDDPVKIKAMELILMDAYNNAGGNFLNVLPLPLHLTVASDYNSVPDELKHLVVLPPSNSFRQNTLSKSKV